jgi:hypothetical protein
MLLIPMLYGELTGEVRDIIMVEKGDVMFRSIGTKQRNIAMSVIIYKVLPRGICGIISPSLKPHGKTHDTEQDGWVLSHPFIQRFQAHCTPL